MFKKILIGFDGSDKSKRALHYAFVLSEKFGSELIILTVYQKRVLPIFSTENDLEGEVDLDIYEEYWEAVKQQYKSILSNAEEIAKRDWPLVKYVALFVEGRPSTQIMSVASKYEVDLIVLGSRGLGGVTGWLLGSTSKSVIEHCKRPIFIVK
jgi:nucleotide-binding universal stress UspA family protein